MTRSRSCTRPIIQTGIDFGTSNSAVGVSTSGAISLVPLELGETSIPTALFFNAEDHRTHFGREAIAEYTDGVHGRLMRSIKSILGSTLVDDTTVVAGHSLTYENIISVFLKHLREVAQTHVSAELSELVLGRPVHFVDDDPARDARAQATLENAARGAGFRDVLFQFEPIAAAFDYERTLESDETVLVIDIGGGTSDFTVIQLGPSRRSAIDRRTDILSTSGIHIGGTDFDRRLSLVTAMRSIGMGSKGNAGRPIPSSIYFDLATWHRINLLYSRKEMHLAEQLRLVYQDSRHHDRLMTVLHRRLGHRLAADVERSKIAVAGGGRHVLELAYIERGLQCAVTEKALVRSIADDVDRVLKTADAAVGAALGKRSPDTLYFTGGSTAVRSLRDSFQARFPDSRIVAGDMFGSVARGLAVFAGRAFPA